MYRVPQEIDECWEFAMSDSYKCTVVGMPIVVQWQDPLNQFWVLSVRRVEGTRMRETTTIRKPKVVGKRGTCGGDSRVRSRTSGYIRVQHVSINGPFFNVSCVLEVRSAHPPTP